MKSLREMAVDAHDAALRRAQVRQQASELRRRDEAAEAVRRVLGVILPSAMFRPMNPDRAFIVHDDLYLVGWVDWEPVFSGGAYRYHVAVCRLTDGELLEVRSVADLGRLLSLNGGALSVSLHPLDP